MKPSFQDAAEVGRTHERGPGPRIGALDFSFSHMTRGAHRQCASMNSFSAALYAPATWLNLEEVAATGWAGNGEGKANYRGRLDRSRRVVAVPEGGRRCRTPEVRCGGRYVYCSDILEGRWSPNRRLHVRLSGQSLRPRPRPDEVLSDRRSTVCARRGGRASHRRLHLRRGRLAAVAGGRPDAGGGVDAAGDPDQRRLRRGVSRLRGAVRQRRPGARQRRGRPVRPGRRPRPRFRRRRRRRRAQVEAGRADLRRRRRLRHAGLRRVRRQHLVPVGRGRDPADRPRRGNRAQPVGRAARAHVGRGDPRHRRPRRHPRQRPRRDGAERLRRPRRVPAEGRRRHGPPVQHGAGPDLRRRRRARRTDHRARRRRQHARPRGPRPQRRGLRGRAD